MVTSPLRIAYFGTPEFAVPTFEALHASAHRVVVVVTQPDRPRGRGQKPSPGPVKAAAEAAGLPVLQPERLKTDDFLSAISGFAPDLGVVAAYGKILPEALLQIPRLGMINVHASLLPRWRGASPIHRAVMDGDPETGISIMRVVKALDAGAVFETVRRAILPEETSEELERDLAQMGGKLLVSVVDRMAAGEAVETPQDEGRVTYAPRLTKEEGLIDWSLGAAALHNRIRGLHPWPHAYTFFSGSRVILLKSTLPVPPVSGPTGVAAGAVLSLAGDAIQVGAGDGLVLNLTLLQAEGRRPVSGREFAAGLRLQPGARFGQ